MANSITTETKDDVSYHVHEEPSVELREVAESFIDVTLTTAENNVNNYFKTSKPPIYARNQLWTEGVEPYKVQLGKAGPPQIPWHWEIPNFSVQQLVERIKDYIENWFLSEGTKYCIKPILSECNGESVYEEDLGYKIHLHTICSEPEIELDEVESKKYAIDVIFSRPTMVCPNPLAVAKVHFIVNTVPMEEDEPVVLRRPTDMLNLQDPNSKRKEDTLVRVKYRMEGFKTWHNVNKGSFDFQNDCIQFILNTKTKYYEKHPIVHDNSQDGECLL